MTKEKPEYATVPIQNLKPDPVNARKHSETNLKAIMGSLTEFGQQRPILVTREHLVIAGNGTLAAAKALGWTSVQVRYTNLSGSEAVAYALADNRTAELAEWDKDILGSQLQALYEDGFGIADIGFDPGDWIKDVIPNNPFDSANEDVIPDDAPSRVKRGEIWQLGDHRVMCGDSTSLDDVQRLFGKEKAKLCFTSPPYSDQREYRGGKELSTEKLAKFVSTASNLVELFAVNLGISRKNGEINCYWDDYICEAKNAGLKLLSWNIWDRHYPASIGQQTAMFPIEHEWIFVFGKEVKELNKTIENKLAGQSIESSTNRQANGKMEISKKRTYASHRALGTIQRIDIHRGESPHPAMFPVALPMAYIEACTARGDIVHEPFCGSGTTLVACEKTSRKCFGMEIDPHYCDIIIQRWESLTGRQAKLVAEG